MSQSELNNSPPNNPPVEEIKQEVHHIRQSSKKSKNILGQIGKRNNDGLKSHSSMNAVVPVGSSMAKSASDNMIGQRKQSS